MDRGTLLISSLASLTIVPVAQAQERRRTRVGWLTGTANPQVASFRAGMRDLGYVEGRDWVLEERDAEGDLGRLEKLAAELASLPVDVLVAVGFTAARPAHRIVKDIPKLGVIEGQVNMDDLLARRPGGIVPSRRPTRSCRS